MLRDCFKIAFFIVRSLIRLRIYIHQIFLRICEFINDSEVNLLNFDNSNVSISKKKCKYRPVGMTFVYTDIE